MTEQLPRDDVSDLRDILVHAVDVPLGMFARLDVAVVRAERARVTRIPWEARLVIACLLFIVLGSSPIIVLTPTLAAMLAVLAIAYPWLITPGTVESSTQEGADARGDGL